MNGLTLKQAQELLLERIEKVKETETISLWEGVDRMTDMQ